MAKNVILLTAQNTPMLVQQVKKINRELNNFIATILAYGTFGGSTLNFYLSPDGGTTLIPITPAPGGTAATLTANGMLQLNIGHPSTNSDLFGIYAQLTGGSGATVTVASYDNNR